MKRKKGIETILKCLFSFTVFFFLISCSDSLSGFGAETTNGEVTVSLTGDSDYDSCLVQIIPTDYNPLSDSSFIEYETYASIEGVATFNLIKSGTYSIYSKNIKTGKRSIITNFMINGDTTIMTELANTGDIEVIFKNSESMLDTINGCLIILGYPEYVKLDKNIEKVDSGYSIVFDSVPASIIRTLSYSSISDETKIQNLSDSVPVFSNDTTYVEAVLYYTFINSSNSNYIRDSITDFLYSSRGVRWVVQGENLLKIDNDSVYLINSVNSNISGGAILSICEGKDKSIWLGTEKGISVSYNTIDWQKYDNDNYGSVFVNVASIVDDDSLVFAGTLGNGLLSFDGFKWSQFTKENSNLPSDSITTLIIDSEGDLLGGTTAGIFNIIGNIVYTYKNVNYYFNSLHITALSQDSAGGFWIGTSAGEIFHLTDTLWFNYSMAINTLSDNSITSIVCDTKGDIWAGSAEGRFYRYPKESKLNGWLVYLGQEGILPGVSITSIDASQNGVIYCGTLGGGMFILGASSIDVTSNWQHCY